VVFVPVRVVMWHVQNKMLKGIIAQVCGGRRRKGALGSVCVVIDGALVRFIVLCVREQCARP
jgi:hypothetical protein